MEKKIGKFILIPKTILPKLLLYLIKIIKVLLSIYFLVLIETRHTIQEPTPQ